MNYTKEELDELALELKHKDAFRRRKYGSKPVNRETPQETQTRALGNIRVLRAALKDEDLPATARQVMTRALKRNVLIAEGKRPKYGYSERMTIREGGQ